MKNQDQKCQIDESDHEAKEIFDCVNVYFRFRRHKADQWCYEEENEQ